MPPRNDDPDHLLARCSIIFRRACLSPHSAPIATWLERRGKTWASADASDLLALIASLDRGWKAKPREWQIASLEANLAIAQAFPSRIHPWAEESLAAWVDRHHPVSAENLQTLTQALKAKCSTSTAA